MFAAGTCLLIRTTNGTILEIIARLLVWHFEQFQRYSTDNIEWFLWNVDRNQRFRQREQPNLPAAVWRPNRHVN